MMDRVSREGDGLFPAPSEIKLSCSCPDWADMCKHVAAALYGVGARLDEKPQLLFVLRGVDESELLAGAGQDLPLKKVALSAAKVLDGSDVAALFGLEMADSTNFDTPTPAAPKRRASKKPVVKKTAVAKISNPLRETRTKSESKWATLANARKRRAQRQRPQRSA